MPGPRVSPQVGKMLRQRPFLGKRLRSEKNKYIWLLSKKNVLGLTGDLLVGRDPPPTIAALAAAEQPAAPGTAGVENSEMLAAALGAFKAAFLFGLLY